MAKQYVDVWKYPHMTYKKAFVIATIISIITVGVAFISFSDYIESQMTGSLQINFLTEQEAEKQVEEIKEQIKEEKVHELQYQKNWKIIKFNLITVEPVTEDKMGTPASPQRVM